MRAHIREFRKRPRELRCAIIPFSDKVGTLWKYFLDIEHVFHIVDYVYSSVKFYQAPLPRPWVRDRAPVLQFVSQPHDFECVLVLTWSTAPVRRFQSLRAQGCRTSGCGLGAYLAMPRSLREDNHLANCSAADPAMVPRWRLTLLCTKPCARQRTAAMWSFR